MIDQEGEPCTMGGWTIVLTAGSWKFQVAPGFVTMLVGSILLFFSDLALALISLGRIVRTVLRRSGIAGKYNVMSPELGQESDHGPVREQG